ncbi:MAG TPA: fatty acid desaturase, partial [Terriglobia bacterium]|nr:fatty acid desaturase [Terriglobia bacterium]
METVATHSISRGLLRHSRWDAVLIGLSLLHPMVILLVPSVPVIAIGLWWNSNTISHNFIHLPFFRSSRWNRAYSMFLSLLLGFPQSVWRERHMAHHAGHRSRLRFSTSIVVELGVVIVLWGFLLFTFPGFFLFIYLPGYALGLGLCFLQGYFEHVEGTTSYY